MRAIFYRLSPIFIFLVVLCCGAASAEEGIARLSEFTGEVSIQRGEEIIIQPPVPPHDDQRRRLAVKGKILAARCLRRSPPSSRPTRCSDGIGN